MPEIVCPVTHIKPRHGDQPKKGYIRMVYFTNFRPGDNGNGIVDIKADTQGEAEILLWCLVNHWNKYEKGKFWC